MSESITPTLLEQMNSSATGMNTLSGKDCFSRLLELLETYDGDPLEGLAGYLVTEDPTYLPEHTEIKMLIRSMGRDELLRYILLRALNRHSSSEEV